MVQLLSEEATMSNLATLLNLSDFLLQKLHCYGEALNYGDISPSYLLPVSVTCGCSGLPRFIDGQLHKVF